MSFGKGWESQCNVRTARVESPRQMYVHTRLSPRCLLEWTCAVCLANIRFSSLGASSISDLATFRPAVTTKLLVSATYQCTMIELIR